MTRIRRIMKEFKHYWEVLKAFEEGKTLEHKSNGSYWSIEEDDGLLEFINYLSDTYKEEWQIAKSDYEKALELVRESHTDDINYQLSPYEMEQIAQLMVEFKNGKE